MRDYLDLRELSKKLGYAYSMEGKLVKGFPEDFVIYYEKSCPDVAFLVYETDLGRINRDLNRFLEEFDLGDTSTMETEEREVIEGNQLNLAEYLVVRAWYLGYVDVINFV